MNFFNELIIFIANLNFGENYFAVTASCVLLFSIILLIFSIFFKRLRKINKAVVIGATICVYLLCVIKTFCQIYVFEKTPYLQLVLCSFIALLELIVLVALCLLKSPNGDFIKENGVIGGLFAKIKSIPIYENDQTYATNPFRKIERLKTEKMFDDKNSDDFNVNYPYVLSRIESLDFDKLSSPEKAEIFNLKTMLERFSSKKLTDVERESLCDGLRKFLKISAKHDEFLQDKF
ncbi:MAG: hypothetical protein IJW64_05980 [Clostridia bacterium]|nr:hypothetical protein [Clostridia bacterium]